MASRFEIHSACPNRAEHVTAMAIHASGNQGANTAGGMNPAPSQSTALRALGRVHPRSINLPPNHPPNKYPISPKTKGTHA